VKKNFLCRGVLESKKWRKTLEYLANETRYDNMIFNRCGKSGLFLPAISLGFWKNFGFSDIFSNCEKMVLKAFDLGITHFDLANTYGPENGAAEENFARIFKHNLRNYRDEIIIATKAGNRMFPGPYGIMGSRKHIISSLDRSLKRLGVDYVDIFYQHRPDPETPLEESLLALDQTVKSGKALYIGLSKYSYESTERAKKIFDELKTPYIVNQARYSMFDRNVEKDFLQTIEKIQSGLVVFSPLAQGLLSEKYINGIPENSRATKSTDVQNLINENNVAKVKKLNEIAKKRDQKLSQMALAWLLNDKRVTSTLIGASSCEQIEENVSALKNLTFTEEELSEIENILK
jgi:L-glyceraldehyde 3-phosphate reductase